VSGDGVNGRGRDTRHKAGSGSGPRNHAEFIWSVADLPRGDYKQSEYGKVILPLTVLRRLDGVLAPTKRQVLEKHKQLEGRLEKMAPVLNRITGVQFTNTSELDLRRVLDDPPNAADQLRQYVGGFSAEVQDIFEKFDLDAQISRLDASNLLYLALDKFVDIDLRPENVSNTEMGYIYEELIRRFEQGGPNIVELAKESSFRERRVFRYSIITGLGPIPLVYRAELLRRE